MKIIFILVIIVPLFSSISEVTANWYSGTQKADVYGIRAYISAPSIINIYSEGESNWVSSYYEDSNGKDWIQTGWRYYSDFIWNPKQYVEYCYNCNSSTPIYFMDDSFASHIRGTTIHYQINRTSNNDWCAYTEGYLRYCAQSLHTIPIIGMAKSEIHGSSYNSLDTIYDVVEYLDPATNSWKILEYPQIWQKDFPYDIKIYNLSYFRTYRMDTTEIYFPLIQKLN